MFVHKEACSLFKVIFIQIMELVCIHTRTSNLWTCWTWIIVAPMSYNGSYVISLLFLFFFGF